MKRLVVVLAIAISGLSATSVSASTKQHRIPSAHAVPAVAFSDYGNLTRDNCQSAAVGNMVQAWTGSAPVAQSSINALLRSIGGPNSTVDAHYFQDLVVPYWRTHAIGGVKATQWRLIAPTGVFGTYAVTQRLNVEKQIALHGALYGEANVPSYAPTSGPWTVANSHGGRGTFGHAFAVVGYSKNYLDIVTWGAVQQVTWNWWAHYGTALYVVGHKL